MTTELHVAWAFDCESCGRENFLRATTGDADEVARILAEDHEREPILVLIAEDEQTEQVGPELHETPSLLAEIAIAPMYVKCQHCGHQSAAEAPKIDEETLNGPHPGDDVDLDDDPHGDDQPPAGADPREA